MNKLAKKDKRIVLFPIFEIFESLEPLYCAALTKANVIAFAFLQNNLQAA